MTERSIRLAFVLILSVLACATSDLALAQPNIEQATTEQQAAARSAYAQGVEAFGRGDYVAALAFFETADNAVSSPNTKLMRARCLAKLGRNADANAMYDATLREAALWDDGRYQASADAATQEQRELASKLSPDAAGATPAMDATPASPPATEPAAVAAQAPPAELPASPAPATAPSHASSRSSVPVLPIVLGAAGGAAIASFAVFGAMSGSQWNKLENACPTDMHCDPSLTSRADRGQTYQTIANVSLGLGAALIATSATLFVLHWSKGTPEVAVTPTGMRVRGTL
jgi:hypothetical protein